MSTAFMSLFTFSSLTTIYIAIRWFSTDAYKARNWAWIGKLVSVGYIFLVLISQYYINIGHTKVICGTVQRSKALLYTLVPNILMFGLIFGILIILPGWKAPFADTIGYTVIKTMGVTDLLRKMMKTTNEKKIEPVQHGGGPPPALPPPSIVAAKASTKAVEMKEILKYVQDDPSLLINEITPGNWDQWMDETALPKLFKKEYNKNHPDIAKLYNLVSLRDLMGEFIWLILAGFLVITTQINALYSINCKGESSKIEKKIQEKWEKLENKAKTNDEKKYWSRE